MTEGPKHPGSRSETPLKIRDPKAWERQQRNVEIKRRAAEYAASATRILALIAAVSIPSSEPQRPKSTKPSEAPIVQETIPESVLSEKQRQLLERLDAAQRKVLDGLNAKTGSSNLSVILTDRSSSRACDAARLVAQNHLAQATQLMAYLRVRAGALGDSQLEKLVMSRNTKLRQTPQEVAEYFERSAAQDERHIQNDKYYHALVECTALVKGAFFFGRAQRGIREKVSLLGPIVTIVERGIRNNEPFAEEAAQALINLADGLLAPYAPTGK